MIDLARGVLIALAAYALASALGSLVALGLCALVPRVLRPAARARLLLVLRLMPTMLALLTVLLLVVPAYLAHEPWGIDEPLGSILLGLACLGVVLLLWGGGRAARAVLATRRLRVTWQKGARPIEIPGAPASVFLLDHPLPVVSVVGFRHPRLFIAEQVLGVFTRAELQAALAHERGHMDARDNVKRLAFEACPDWLALTRFGDRLRRSWAAAAEAAADSAAAAGGSALDLASALVKVARLFPPGAVDLPSSALAGGSDLGPRLRRLLQAPPPSRSGRLPVLALWGLIVLAPVALAVLSTSPWALARVHALAEALVRLG